MKKFAVAIIYFILIIHFHFSNFFALHFFFAYNTEHNTLLAYKYHRVYSQFCFLVCGLYQRVINHYVLDYIIDQHSRVIDINIQYSTQFYRQ